jgi:uncharacterized protein (TIGR02147 family)
MASAIFKYQDYRKFLEICLSQRGAKKEFSEYIGCQTTFLSNVISGYANLSLEHAIRGCESLQLTPSESHFFMLTVQFEKAGTPTLKNYYLKQIKEIQSSQSEIKNHISAHETIPVEDQMKFYQSWMYVAVHILCAIPEYQSRRNLCAYLNLSPKNLNPIIDFMVQQGLIHEEGGRLIQGQKRVHLSKNSPFLTNHHLNWRVKATQSLDYDRENDLHYTMVMSLSKRDVERMKEIILESISKTDLLLKKT